jgi:hypothetical protein
MFLLLKTETNYLKKRSNRLYKNFKTNN